MQCQEFRPLIDSYIKDELLVETNHEILGHADECVDCRDQLAQRRQLHSRLKKAVDTAQESIINDAFAKQLKGELRERALSPSVLDRFRAALASPGFRLAGAVAGLVLVVFGSLFLLNSLGNTGRSIKNPGDEVASNNLLIVDAVRAAWSELAVAAKGDHENCAVKYNLAEDPITLDEAATKYGAFNKDLDESLKTALKDDVLPKRDQIKYIESHSCVYAGRRFAHVVFEKQGKLISILVTDSDLPGDGSTPNSTFAAFAVDHHAVFVVSDLGHEESSRIAKLIEPAVRSHIAAARA